MHGAAFRVRVLNPVAICDELKAQPPLTRDEATKAYISGEVDRMLTFADGNEDRAGQAHLIFKISDHQMLRIVEGTVSPAKYPRLKTLRADAPVRVRGRIRGIGVLSIEPEISELSLASDTFQSGKRG